MQPEDLLAELGVKPGENRDGVRFAKNMCPSQGTMDIFVEPVLPRPSLVILGASPVAMALAEQARPLGFHVTVAAPAADLSGAPDADVVIDGYELDGSTEARRFIVVSTQGKGDEAALRGGVAVDGGVPRLRRQPAQDGGAAREAAGRGRAGRALDRVKAPAGLDLGAITPEEIALSILAEVIRERRRGQRGEPQT